MKQFCGPNCNLHWLSIEYIFPGRKFELGNNVVVGIFKRHCPTEDTDLNSEYII